MQSGYFQPLHSSFILAWMWWIILLAFQQVLFYENNLSLNWFSSLLLFIAIVYLYFLLRQRRFFASQHHLYFTRDFRLRMVELSCDRLENVKLSDFRFIFDYEGKNYHYFIFGRSNQLLQNLLKENHVTFEHTILKARKEAKRAN